MTGSPVPTDAAPASSREPLSSGQLQRVLATLAPGYFALVMATGIISIGAGLVGHPYVHRRLLGARARG
jgi:hypothetical protein